MNLEIVKFCAEEVERQRAKPIAVYWMVNAWMEAQFQYNDPHLEAKLVVQRLTPMMVEHWGKLVDPEKNAKGVRTCRVTVGIHIPPGPEQVARLLDQLFTPENLSRLKPEEVYKQFQEIHPFRDGNGRTGKIIFNWLNGTLEHPILPPNFWGIVNL